MMSSAPFESGTPPSNLVDLVRSASTQENSRPGKEGFSLTKAGVIELAVSPLLGLYLGYAVGRLPEVFESMNIPHLPMILMLLFLAMLGLAVPSDSWQRVWQHSRPMRLVAILMVLAFATIPTAIWPSGSLEFLRTRYMVSLVVFICCLVFLRDRRAFRRSVMLYVLCITVVAVDTLATYDLNKTVLDENGDPVVVSVELTRVNVGRTLDPNDFGAILSATFPLALWLGVGSFRRRLFWSSCALLLCAAVVPTSSRGSLLAFAAAATVLLGLGARGWRRVLTFILVAGGVALFVGLASGAQMGRFTDFGANDYNLQSGEGRWHFWKQGFVWMLKRPWGYGLNGFPTYYGILNGSSRAAHSTWVQYGMELGITGLATFVALCVFLFKALYRHRRRAIGLNGVLVGAHEEEALASHLIAMLAAILVADSFLSQAYNPLLYMALGLVAAALLGSPMMESSAPLEEVPVASPRSQSPQRRVAPQWTRQA